KHLGSGSRDRCRAAGAAAAGVRGAAQRHLRGVPAAQAPAAARQALARFRQGALRAPRILGRHNRSARQPGGKKAMTLEAILAYLHFLAILTMVVFIASEAALCRVDWLNAAVVERLARVDMVYGIAAI